MLKQVVSILFIHYYLFILLFYALIKIVYRKMYDTQNNLKQFALMSIEKNSLNTIHSNIVYILDCLSLKKARFYINY